MPRYQDQHLGAGSLLLHTLGSSPCTQTPDFCASFLLVVAPALDGGVAVNSGVLPCSHGDCTAPAVGVEQLGLPLPKAQPRVQAVCCCHF